MPRSLQGTEVPVGLWDELQQSLSWQALLVSSVVKQRDPVPHSLGLWSSVLGQHYGGKQGLSADTQRAEECPTAARCVEEPGRQRTQPGRC